MSETECGHFGSYERVSLGCPSQNAARHRTFEVRAHNRSIFPPHTAMPYLILQSNFKPCSTKNFQPRMNIIEGSPGATSNAPLEGANSLTLNCGRLYLPFIAINLVWCKTANLMTQRAGGLFQSICSNPTATTQPNLSQMQLLARTLKIFED